LVFEVLVTANTKKIVSWNVAPRILVQIDHSFRGVSAHNPDDGGIKHFLILINFYENARYNIPEDFNQLIQWNIVGLEQLIDVQIAITRLLWKPKVQYYGHKTPSPVPILSQVSRVHNLRLGLPSGLFSYEILSNILLARLTPYADEIIGDHKCGFRLND
jgi:hypothetical protein